MRDIKFRAWDCEDSEMIAPENLLTINDNRYLNESLVHDEKVTFMQFTGFQDSKGSDIYEGDIIEKDDDKFARLGVVSFIHGCWMVASEDKERYFSLHFYLKQVKVIGNVHETPELLKGDNSG